MKALKDKNETLKKQAEEAEAVAADLKKKLRAAEGEAKKAQDAVKNNKDTKKLELTKKVLDETRAKLAQVEERKGELDRENEKLSKELAEVRGYQSTFSSVTNRNCGAISYHNSLF